MSTYHFEVRKLTIDDLELGPACFKNDRDGHAVWAKAAQYAQFFAEGINHPVYYFRNVEPQKQRWAGIIELGNGPLQYQKGLHDQDLAQEHTPTIRYRKVSDHPKIFEIETMEPYSLLRFIDDGKGGVLAEFKEGIDGSILDLKVEPFPVCVISHSNEMQPFPYFQVNTMVHGTYMGQPVRGMGGFDRTFLFHNTSQHELESKYAATYRCTCALYSGVRQDGRKECVYALITNKNGKGVGMYYLDGEKTIVTDEVHLDADFCRLPYVDDDTVVYTKATWKIGPKIIHFDGKWGTKSFTAYPKLDKHGQSQCFGSWYEGNTPYTHEIEHTFNENTGDAFARRIADMGFKIID